MIIPRFWDKSTKIVKQESLDDKGLVELENYYQ